MGVDWSVLAKLPNMDMWARPINVTPAGGTAYANRGIWHEDENDFIAEDGSIVTDHKVSIDVRDAEFAVVPRQGDMIDIPADGTVPAPKGSPFTVLSAHGDGGGMTNLVLEEYTTTVAAPHDGISGKFTPAVRQRGRLDR
jgi:hypothetical protein